MFASEGNLTRSSVLSSQARGGLSEVANYWWLPVVSRRVSDCTEEGISGEPAVGDRESEMTSPGEDVGLGEGWQIQIKQDPSRSYEEIHILTSDQILCQSPRSHEARSYTGKFKTAHASGQLQTSHKRLHTYTQIQTYFLAPRKSLPD